MLALPTCTRRRFLGLVGTTALAAHAATRSTIALGDVPADVKQLEDLGAQVTMTGEKVTRLFFKDCSKLGEAEFQCIGRIRTLQGLTLYGQCKGLTDGTLPLLAGLQELEELGTDGVQISDAGMAGFAPLGHLRSLAFFHPSFGMKGFDGSGFASLQSLPKLERLTIAGSPFNDQGMAAVGQIKQLRDFRTWHTYQTQQGNRHLLDLPGLKSLWLGQRLRRYDGSSNRTSLDDATLDVLARLTTLESLVLDEARLSLAALSRLQELKSLKKLQLQRIEITPAEIAELRGRLPGVTVDYKPLTDDERTKLDAFLKV